MRQTTTLNILFRPRTTGCMLLIHIRRIDIQHLTYAPATHLRRGDVPKMTKYDFSSFTKGIPHKIDKKLGVVAHKYVFNGYDLHCPCIIPMWSARSN